MPEAATARGVSRRRVFEDAAPHLDGLGLIRQLWEAHPCGEAATNRSLYSRRSGATHDGVGPVLVG